MYYARPSYNHRNVKRLFATEGEEFVMFDFETTGLDIIKDRPVQIAALKCRINNGEAEIISAYNTFIRQDISIPEKVSKKNHITDDMLYDAPSEEDVFDDIFQTFGESAILCGYNIESFDVPILKNLYERHGKTFREIAVLDVLEMVRDNIPPSKLKKRNQESVAKYYGVEYGIRFHDACGDVEVCMRILNIMSREYEKRNAAGTKRIYVNAVYFSNGHNKDQKGIYVITQFDSKKVHLWYSTFNKSWCSAQLDLSEYDIDTLTIDALNATARKLKRNALTLEEFGRLSEKDFQK